MAKKAFTTITSGFQVQSALTENFDDLESILQSQVLYRLNPSGEPNEMNQDLDMNGYNILNAGSGTTGLASASLTMAISWGAQRDGTGTHSLSLSDVYRITEISASAVTAVVALSEESVGGWASGQKLSLLQKGSGKILVSPAGGVSIRSPETLRSSKQYSRIDLVYRGSDIWYLSGDLEESV